MTESNDTEANRPQEQYTTNSNNNEANATPEALSYLERLAMELGFEYDFVTPRADQPIIPTPNTPAPNPNHEDLSYLARLAMDLGLQMDSVTCIRGPVAPQQRRGIQIDSPELEQILAEAHERHRRRRNTVQSARVKRMLSNSSEPSCSGDEHSKVTPLMLMKLRNYGLKLANHGNTETLGCA